MTNPTSEHTTNTIFLHLFGGVSEYPLTVENLLTAAELYKDSAMFASDTIFVGTRRIYLTDIIELCMPGKKRLAKVIVNDLFDTEFEKVSA